MRHAIILIPGLILYGLVACGGGTTPPAGDGDAAAGDGDAAAGDGDAAAGDGDAAAGDAALAIDAAEIDAPVAGPATITVRTRGAPVAGVDVVWSDPTGAVMSHGATNSAGAATETLLAGSAVTLAVTSGVTRYTVTYLAIEPGDDLVWEAEPPPPVRHGDLSVTLPGAQTSATRYRVQLGCGDALMTQTPTVAVTGTVDTGCLGSDQTIDVLATAHAPSGAVIGYAVRTDVPTVANGTTSVVMGAWQTTLDPLAFALTNVPGGSSNLRLEAHFRADGLDFRGIDTAGLPTAANITLQSGYVQGGIVERLQYVLVLTRGPMQEPQGLSVVVAGRPDAPASVSHDFATLLPLVTSATASDATGRLRIETTTGASIAGADGVLVSASWRQGTDAHQAVVVVPPGLATSLVTPVLPDALAGYRPTATSVFTPPRITVVEADFVAGYRDFRAIAARAQAGVGVGLLPAAGGLVRATIGGTLPP